MKVIRLGRHRLSVWWDLRGWGLGCTLSWTSRIEGARFFYVRVACLCFHMSVDLLIGSHVGDSESPNGG